MSPRTQGCAQERRHRPVALFLAVLLSGTSAVSIAAPKSQVHAVDIEAMQFSPATLEIKTGDAVIWKNKDPFPHDATAEQGGFGSGEIQSERSWKFKAREKGVFPYVCTRHPGMRAVLVVK